MPLSTLLPEPVTEILHGVAVSDPFRWLEDRGSDWTVSWVAKQNHIHDAYFAGIPNQEAIRSRVNTYLNVDVFDQPVKVEGKLFYRRRRKDQEQACICVKETAASAERILVDPAPRGPFASVAIHRVSEDGSLLAYELKKGASDYKEIHVLDIAEGRELPDYLSAGYGRGFVFAPDKSGFYYSHDTASSAEEHSIQFHPFGSTVRDPILFCSPRTVGSRLLLSADAIHLGALCIREEDAELRIDFHLAQHGSRPRWTPVSVDKTAPFWPSLHDGRIFVWMDEDAPNGKMVEIATDGKIVGIVVPEPEGPIQQIARIGDTFYVRYLVERKWVIRRWTLDGLSNGDLLLPERHTVQILPSLSNRAQSLFCRQESFTEPLNIREFRHEEQGVAPIFDAIASSNPRDLRVDEVWYASKDGKEIPMSLLMRKGLDPSPPHPAILTSYGGFGVSMTPQFSVLVSILLELGAIFALPSIRGGGDFGKAWHESARRRHRQVAIDDFIAAAEWLSGWETGSARPLGAFGGSNSGLLVAGAMTQRPDLFQAVLCIAPLLDMVRYECFDQARKWRQEYGTVVDADDFSALYGYSPYHRVEENVDYPPTLFVTGDCDDRCNPAHVRKMAARLQFRPAQTKPILVDYSAERGHSPVLPLSVRVHALSRRIAFFCNELCLPFSPGGNNETTGR